MCGNTKNSITTDVKCTAAVLGKTKADEPDKISLTDELRLMGPNVFVALPAYKIFPVESKCARAY